MYTNLVKLQLSVKSGANFILATSLHFSKKIFIAIDGPLKYFLFDSFSQLNQSSFKQAEEVDYNQLEEMLAAMDNYFSMRQINTAVQQADTLLLLLNIADSRADKDMKLLQVNKFGALQVALNLQLYSIVLSNVICLRL